MASASQKELQKLYASSRNGLDDEGLATLIDASELIMRSPARILLAQMGLDKSVTAPFRLLDNACGAGPIAAELQDQIDAQVLARSKVLCADFHASMVDTLKRRVVMNGWSNIETAVFDAQNSGLPDASFSHITINFAMHLIPDPQAVLRDTMRLLQPGGTFGFTVWHKDNEGWLPDMRTCLEALPFEAPLPNPFPMATHGQPQWTEEGGIEKELKDGGFLKIEINTMTQIVHVDSAEHYVKCFDMIKQWIVNTYWSEESKEKAKGTLDEHMVKHLKDKHDNRGWDLTWKMIFATCQKPM
ncbi:hypothetical protein DL764_003205 [Monosporascus ibericus]|uniref:Methyltransferase type 11 domain-containing protein n=1 Tax=Monosporascus ibericus TaxID=155417 RepID=A0A4Q4TLE2_9PEZI|nr:hypothetical protein DL764_003205 [Monosporascus ibericus]